MGTVRVVVVLVLGQHVSELPLAEDQDPIQAVGLKNLGPALVRRRDGTR
jgi:hypothetical protein